MKIARNKIQRSTLKFHVFTFYHLTVLSTRNIDFVSGNQSHQQTSLTSNIFRVETTRSITSEACDGYRSISH